MPKRLPRTEFIALIAMLFATIAFSIDAMLPALPDIAAELTPDAPNRAQLILTVFILGMGLATLVTGPLSDAIGRKPVILGSAALYILGAAVAGSAGSLEVMLAARFVQGIGGAGPRIAAIAIVRDLYAGRDMARLMSFIMMVFMLVPSVAPMLGAGIMAITGWRGIFGAFVLFSAFGALWLTLRQSETLEPENRRPLHLRTLTSGVVEVMSNRMVLLSMVTQGLCFGMLFSNISSIQQIFDITFNKAQGFPFWFALVGLVSAASSLANANLVGHYGMRALINFALTFQLLLSAIAAGLFYSGVLPASLGFPLYMTWACSIFFLNGFTVGNLNTLAMEPMPHLAGLTATVLGAFGTVIAVAIAAPVGLAFDGTPRPLMVACIILAGLALILSLRLRRPSTAVPA